MSATAERRTLSFLAVRGWSAARRASFAIVWAVMMVGGSAGPVATQAGPRDTVRNTPPYPSWFVSDRPLLKLGAALGDEEDVFFSDVRFAGLLSDGEVVVVDGASSEIRWFSPEGSLVRRAGRSGEGPGEFLRVETGLVLEHDTLVLFDSRNQRLSWFTPEGTLARTRSLPIGGSFGAGLFDIGDEALLLAVEGYLPNIGGAEYNYVRDSVFAVRVSGTARTDTVMRLAGKESFTWVSYVDGVPRGTQQMGVPFGRSTLLGGMSGMLIAVPDGQDRMTFFDLQGRPRRVVQNTGSPRIPVSRELRRRFVEDAVERAVATGGQPEYARSGAEERLDLAPAGQVVPVYDRVLIDRGSEQVWLRDYVLPGGGPEEWTVYNALGAVVGRVTTPAEIEVTQVSRGHIVGVSRDDLGVEFVSIYGISAGSHP